MLTELLPRHSRDGTAHNMLGVIALVVISAAVQLGLADNLVLCPSVVDCKSPSSITCFPGDASECSTGGICCGHSSGLRSGCCVPKPATIPTVEGYPYLKPDVPEVVPESVDGHPEGEAVKGQTPLAEETQPPLEQLPPGGQQSTETASVPTQEPEIDEKFKFETTEELPPGAGQPVTDALPAETGDPIISTLTPIEWPPADNTSGAGLPVFETGQKTDHAQSIGVEQPAAGRLSGTDPPRDQPGRKHNK